nr:alpha-galactosidase [Microbacterium sp. MAH-37]
MVLDRRGPHLPRIVHWGRRLRDADDDALTQLVTAGAMGNRAHRADDPTDLTVAPAYSDGWPGRPALSGSRDGTGFAPAFAPVDVVVDPAEPGTTESVTIIAADPLARLELRLRFQLLVGGLLRTAISVRNDGDSDYALEGVESIVPVPRQADEILDYTGMWIRERSPQRTAFTFGQHVRDSRFGRSHDASSVLVVGTRGFSATSGEVWAAHLGWSGNTRMFAEQVAPSGIRVVGGGELLLPGEVVLSPAEEYESPWLYLAYGTGTNGASAKFHDYLRAIPSHPRGERKVTLNVWEAVYFDHDLERLRGIARLAASAGVERFVLDDGWFLGRRDDRAGLGDWEVDPDVWPDGLHPLIDTVRGLGMEFGLWVEPEMVSRDSELARQHPDWIMGVPGREPATSRSQWVLDLGNRDAWEHVLGRLEALLDEYPISYLKWDHNRDLIDSASPGDGRATVHRQTRALYEMLDVLRERHPELEIENCAGGGGRIDLGLMTRCQRVWASDTTDPLERQRIHEGTWMLLPPELVGAHIGSPQSHTTRRTHSLPFRAGTALFGHLGIEWDLGQADEEELTALRGWVQLYKQLRPLLHSGAAITVDSPDPALRVHGVLSTDGTDGLFAAVQLATSVAASSGRVRLPGLRDHATYRVEAVPAPLLEAGSAWSQVPWWPGPLTLTGDMLGSVGLEAPTLDPESLALFRVTLTEARPAD